MAQKQTTTLLFFLLFFYCGNTVFSQPLSKTAAETALDDDGALHPKGSFNYSEIAGHPRILLSAQDESILKTNIQKNSDLKSVHDFIISQCDGMLETSPVTRIMDGKRLLGVSRTALKRIFFLSYGYRMTNDKRYLVRAENEINAVCAFSDWNPSHFLDVGEMALAVAIGYDWLFTDLKAETKNNARTALKSKAFEPSKNSKYNWFLTSKNNWNQVCNAGLTIAALAIYEGAKQESVEIIERCLESNKLALRAYGPDGNYAEGYSYWSYGTDFQTLLLASLDSALGSDNDLHKEDGFMKTAGYMLYMSGTNGLCFNYSDSSNKENPKPSMFWFAKKSDNPSLLYKEIQMLANGAYTKSYGEDRVLPMVMIYANMESFAHVSPPEKKLWHGAGDTPVVLIRTAWGSNDDRYLGIKAGKAAESHGHMDVGSFVYDALGVRWAADLGMQPYRPLEAKGVDLWNLSQNSQRWDVFRLNNKAHNTLTINGKRHIASGKAEFSKIFDNDDLRGAEIDLTPVFKDDLKRAKRTVALIDNNLQIEDTVEAIADSTVVRWNMLTPADFAIEDDHTFRLEKDGKTMYLKVEATNPIVLKTWSTAPTTDFDEANPNTVLVGFESIIAAGKEYKFCVKLTTEK